MENTPINEENLEENKELENNETVFVKKTDPIYDYFSCFKLDTKSIATNAIVAAMYVALTYAFFFCSYGQLQVRVSELLMILAFFNPNYIIGLSIGCLIANIYSVTMGLTLLDMLFGTLATFLAGIFMSLCRHLLVATIFPAITNGIIVGAELTFLMNTDLTSENIPVLYWTNFGFVFLGEIIAVSIIGYAIFMITIKKTNYKFLKVINAKRNLKFIF